MRKDHSLTGTKIGAWEVGEATSLNGKTAYFCMCECGEESIIRASDLKQQKSLGCSKACSSKYTKEIDEDISNTQIFYWSVGSAVGDGLYSCTCKCGKTKDVSKYNLTHGLSKSCGCRQGDMYIQEADRLVNTSFGKLSIGQHYIKNKIRYYTCTCECGKVIEVQAPFLKSTSKIQITQCHSCAAKESEQRKRQRRILAKLDTENN